MNDLFKSVGYRIAQNRILLNLSQEKLAELAHVSRNFIGCVERAERRPSINTLLRIAKALNISLEELFKDFWFCVRLKTLKERAIVKEFIKKEWFKSAFIILFIVLLLELNAINSTLNKVKNEVGAIDSIGITNELRDISLNLPR